MLPSLDFSRPLAFGVIPRAGGSAIVFSSASGYGVATADGALRALPTPCAGERSPTFVSVSADGAELIAGCTESLRTYSIDLRTGAAPVELPALRGRVGQVTGWSADGASFSITYFAPDAPLAIVASRSGAESITIERRDPELGEVLAAQLAYPAP